MALWLEVDILILCMHASMLIRPETLEPLDLYVFLWMSTPLIQHQMEGKTRGYMQCQTRAHDKILFTS